jgi:competence protein ComEC
MQTARAGATNGVAVAFAIGVIGAMMLPALPDGPVLPFVAPLAALAVLCAWDGGLHAAYAVTCGALLGVCWGVHAAHDALAHRAGACIDGEEVIVKGRIEGLPLTGALTTRFDVALDEPADVAGCTRAPLRRLRVTWYEAQPLEPGDGWLLRVRLRSVRGFINPGTFDYEAQLLQRGIDAAGTVRAGRRIDPAKLGADGLRERLARRAASWQLEHRGILLALTTGDAREIRDAEWSLFQRTGTVHLVVISGMHISLAAAFGYWLGQLVARLIVPLVRRVPSRSVAAVVGVFCAASYTALAGGGIPVERALLVAGVATAALLRFRPPTLSGLFVVVLGSVLALEPLAPLTPGFALSFGAVAVLLAGFAPYTRRLSPLRDLVRAQVVLFVAMLPIGAIVLPQVAWLAPLTNFVAVPLTSLVVVPLLVLGLVLEPIAGLGSTLWSWADRVVEGLLVFLRATDVLPPAPLDAVHVPTLVCVIVGATLWLAPLGGRARLCVVLGMLPLFAGRAAPAEGSFRLAVLDVGQGSAIIVDTARHRLVYDAGPRHLSGFDLGNAVVVPAFRATGARTLDLLVLSHGDLDHVGGAGSVAGQLAPRAMLVGSRTEGFESAPRCRRGIEWQWDDVRFRVLHPTTIDVGSRNDASCVIEIEADAARVLLTGDIEAASEMKLYAHESLHETSLLTVPHHGSKSSSTRQFVVATRPLWAIASVGHGNRFGHPAAQTVERYLTADACVLTTAESGAIVWDSTSPQRLVEWRYDAPPRGRPPFWRVTGRLSRSRCRLSRRACGSSAGSRARDPSCRGATGSCRSRARCRANAARSCRRPTHGAQARPAHASRIVRTVPYVRDADVPARRSARRRRTSELPVGTCDVRSSRGNRAARSSRASRMATPSTCRAMRSRRRSMLKRS